MLLQHKLKPKAPQDAEKLKPLFQFSKKTYFPTSSHMANIKIEEK